jgi:hydrogenase maturation factor HypE
VNAALDLLAIPFLFVAVAGMAICLLLFFVVGGYFLTRATLKVMGLHSGSPEQIRAEIRLLKISGVILLVTVGCTIVCELLGALTGTID